MNKKLLALAVAAAMTAPAAASAADVKVYGKLQAEVSSEDTDTETGGFVRSLTGRAVTHLNRGPGGGAGDTSRTVDGFTVEDNKRGRLGVKAKQKLGNGMTMIGKFEWQVDTTDANPTDGERESWVGIKGNWGTFKAGSVKSAYKYTGGVKYDPFVATNLEARRYGGMFQGRFAQNSFMRNSLSYKTPNLNGFSGWVTYSPAEGNTQNGRGDDSGDWTGAIKYANGPFEVFFSTTHDDGDSEDTINGVTGVETMVADADDVDFWKIGGKFVWGNHTFLGQYEDHEDDADSTVCATVAGCTGAVDDGNILFLAYHLKMGNNTFVVQAADGELDFDDLGTGLLSEQEHFYWAVGAIHKFTKNTRVFGGYRSTDVDNIGGGPDDAEGDVWTVGMRFDF